MPVFQSLCWDSQESSLLVSALVRTKLYPFFKFRLGGPRSPLCLHQPLKGQSYALLSNLVSGFSGVLIACISLIACVSPCKDKTMPFFQISSWCSQESVSGFSGVLIACVSLCKDRLCPFFKVCVGIPRSPHCLCQPL